MKKKSTKNNKPIPEYDSHREQNVLLEEINKQVKTIAEGHSGLARDINGIKVTLNEHGTRFDRIEMVVSENRKDIKELKADVSQLKIDVKRIDNKLDAVTTGHEHRIQKLETIVR